MCFYQYNKVGLEPFIVNTPNIIKSNHKTTFKYSPFYNTTNKQRIALRHINQGTTSEVNVENEKA